MRVQSGPSLTSIKNLTEGPTEGLTQLIQENAYLFLAFYLLPGAFETWQLFFAYPEEIVSYAGCHLQSPPLFLREYGLESQSRYFKDFLLLSMPARALGMGRW